MSEESSKRTITQEDEGKMGIKKARIEEASPGSTEEVFVKVLIPGPAAGGIIGKGGEAMRKLHEDTGCRVKMSKSTDVYPGTNERVAIVHGQVNAAMVVIKHFMGKVRQNENSLDYEERAKEVKIVVPNTSAAMVIGKSGAAIKEIREKTSAGIQINPKQGSPEAQRSVERIITVSNANQPKLEQAVELVLTKVSSDPNHMAYPNLSYAGSGGPIHNESANAEPVNYPPFARGGPHFGGGVGGGPGPLPPHNPGPPIPSLFHHGGGGGGMGYGGGGGLGEYVSAGPPHHGGPSPHMGGPPVSAAQPVNLQGKLFGQPEAASPFGGHKPSLGMAPITPSSMGGGGSSVGSASGGSKFNPMEGLGNMDVLQFLDSLQSTLRSSGFNEQAVAEIMQAMQVLAKYNIMGLGLGLGVAAMATLRTESSKPAAPPVEQNISRVQQDNRPFQTPTERPQEAVFMTSQTSDPFFTPERHAAPTGNGELSAASAYFSSGAVSSGDAMMGAPRQEIGTPSGRRMDGATGAGSQGSRWDSGERAQGGGGYPGSGAERSFAQSVMKMKQTTDPRKMEFELPEQIVGAVMGPKATTLAEIQRYSGATVEISRKSEAGGGTAGYRTITIRASDPESVRAGRFMVERAINEEQKRRQHSQNAGAMY